MSSHDPRRKLIALGVFVAPIVLVKLTGAWLGAAGPREATAQVAVKQEDPGFPMGAVVVRRVPNPERERVAAYLDVLRTQPFGPSPFYYETRPVEAPVQVPIEAPPAELPSLEVNIGAIMAMRDGNIALINGKPHRVGDPAPGSSGAGWRISAIDSTARSVTFEHESGKVEVRSVR